MATDVLLPLYWACLDCRLIEAHHVASQRSGEVIRCPQCHELMLPVMGGTKTKKRTRNRKEGQP